MNRAHPVLHVLDTSVNLDTPYFWSLATRHGARFPTLFGLLDSTGDFRRYPWDVGRVFRVGGGTRAGYPAAVLGLVRVARANSVDVIHAHFFDPTVVGLVAARISGRRFVFTRHHADNNLRLGKRLHTAVDAWCGGRADKVIAVSEATRRIMIEKEGISAARIVTVYNGMEPLKTPHEDEVRAVREELGLDGVPVCLMPARLHEEKGHRYLLAALREIVVRVGRVQVLIAGEGPHRDRIEKVARDEGVDHFVQFLGRRDDIPALLAASTVVVLPSLAESFGYALLEAMSLGRPIVATTVGGIPEVVGDGIAGLLVPPADAIALAAAVSRVLADPSLAVSLGQQGRLRARGFAFDDMMAGYERTYDALWGTDPPT